MINLGAQVSLAVEGSECQGGKSTFKSKSHLEGFELQEGPLRKLRSHMDCTREGVFRDLTATGSRKGVVSSVKQGGKLTASCSCASGQAGPSRGLSTSGSGGGGDTEPQP